LKNYELEITYEDDEKDRIYISSDYDMEQVFNYMEKLKINLLRAFIENKTEIDTNVKKDEVDNPSNNISDLLNDEKKSYTESRVEHFKEDIFCDERNEIEKNRIENNKPCFNDNYFDLDKEKSNEQKSEEIFRESQILSQSKPLIEISKEEKKKDIHFDDLPEENSSFKFEEKSALDDNRNFSVLKNLTSEIQQKKTKNEENQNPLQNNSEKLAVECFDFTKSNAINEEKLQPSEKEVSEKPKDIYILIIS